MDKLTYFDILTRTTETLGSFLAALAVPAAPWDDAFHRCFCDTCPAENCDACPHEAERNNPVWWLGLEAQTNGE